MKHIGLEGRRWREEIGKRLAELRLAPAREAEIAEELAGHLQQQYELLVAQGATEAEALRA